MKVGVNGLFVVPRGAGGTWTYLRSVMRELPRLDRAVEYTIFESREIAGALDPDGAANVRQVVCPVRAARRPIRLLYEYSALPIQARRRQVDVLFCPSFTAPRYPGYATVVTIHDMRHEDLPETFPPLYRLMLTRLARRAACGAAGILADSAYTKRRIVAAYHLPEDRVRVAPLAADPHYFAPVSHAEMARVRRTYHLRDPYLFSLAAPGYQKNLDVVIDAFIALRRQSPAVRLVAPGFFHPGGAALRAKARAAGTEGEVIPTGWIPDADLPALYQGAAAFIMPSRYEGFGIPVLEAMASGVPVVTTTATSLPEVAGDAALLVAPDDAAALTTALRRLLEDATLRDALIARGNARARRFSWRETAQITLRELRAAARRDPRRPA